MKLQTTKERSHETIALNGLWVRNASIFDDTIRLELSPSTEDSTNYLRHLNKLDASGSFEVDIPLEMFEKLIAPDEVGTREHKIAMLPGNCIDLKVKLDENNDLLPVDGGHDASYILSGDEKTGFRPTTRFTRLFRTYTSQLAKAHVFSRVRDFFKNTNGALVPQDASQALLPHQKDMIRILTPYSKHFCDDPSKVRTLNVSALNGNFLGVEQRLNSVLDVLETEETFSKLPSSSPLFGKVTLTDVLGTPADNTWEVESRKDLDATLRNTRLSYAVTSLDNHVKGKLIPNIAEQMSKALGKPLTNEQREEVSAEFNRFLAQLTDASQKRLEPLRNFCSLTGQVNQNTPEIGLAVLNHLADLNRAKTPEVYALKDGTKLDFSQAISKMFADPRTFGAPLDTDPKHVKQAANSVLLNYVSRELSSAYWGITSPTPGADSIDALLNVNKFKASEHFTNRKNPVSDVDNHYNSFIAARNLLINQVEEYSGYSNDKTILTPPKQMLHRFMEKSAGNADVTRSRGLLLSTACMMFRKPDLVPDEKVDALLREGDLLTGKAPGNFADCVKHVMQAYDKSKAEATFAVLLHESISTHNVQLGQRLQQFGEDCIPDFKNKLEQSLDSQVRARSLTVETLGKRASESPEEVYTALNPRAKGECELAYAKVTVVSSAAMRVLNDTLRRSFGHLANDMSGSLELNNIETPVFNGSQSRKMLDEVIHTAYDEEILEYFNLASIRDPKAREQAMNGHMVKLGGNVEKSKAAVEIEADSKCYPSGQSPRRQAKALLKDAFNKAIMGKGTGEIDAHMFAPPGMG